MITPQTFFESSRQIDVGTVVPLKHVELRDESGCDQKQEAKLLLDELRKRLRSADGLRVEMSQDSKERLIALLSNQ